MGNVEAAMRPSVCFRPQLATKQQEIRFERLVVSRKEHTVLRSRGS